MRARAERHLTADPGAGTAEEILDTLAARSPDPFATRLERRPGERETRWAHLLTGMVEQTGGHVEQTGGHVEPDPDPRADDAPPRRDLAIDVAELWTRVERLERLLGLEEDVSSG